MTIARCTHTNLREVFAAVHGLPAPVQMDEFNTLHTRFARAWPVHEFASRRALLPEPVPLASADLAVGPTWIGQLAWERRWVGRWGHRLLALHRTGLDAEAYGTYDETFAPTLAEWLGLAQEAYAFAQIDPSAAAVTFGYVNSFALDADAPDLSQWFKLNLKLDAIGADSGLDEITIGTTIRRPELRARVRLHLAANEVDGVTHVGVHTIAECDLSEGSRFSDTVSLLAEIRRAKVLAKDTFFSFLTERAMIHMGATDAA